MRTMLLTAVARGTALMKHHRFVSLLLPIIGIAAAMVLLAEAPSGHAETPGPLAPGPIAPADATARSIARTRQYPLLGLATATPTPTAAASPITAVLFDSEPGDYIGGGRSVVFTAANATFTPSSNRSELNLGIATAGFPFTGALWNVDIAAPPGTPLTPGVYENAVRAAFRSAGQPGLDINGDGRGCNTVSGRFIVQEATFAGDGSITRFAASFEQHCEGGPAALFGEVRFNSTIPFQALSVAPDALAFPDQRVGTLGAARVATITNVGSAAVSIRSATVAGLNAGDFTVQSDACSGRTLAIGATCDVTVQFAPLVGGTRSATLAITDTTFRGHRELPLSGTGIASTPTPTPTATPTAAPTPVGVPPKANGVNGVFGSVHFRDGYEETATVRFTAPLESVDYVVLLTAVDRACVPQVVGKERTGFQIRCPGSGGGVDYAVFLPSDQHGG